MWFKGRGWFKTLNYNQSGFKLESGKLALSKIGEIPIKLHRKIKGKVKGVICQARTLGQVARDISGGGGIGTPAEDGQGGRDRCLIKRFLSLKNPRFYERTLERIRVRQKQLSKKREGSANRRKARSSQLFWGRPQSAHHQIIAGLKGTVTSSANDFCLGSINPCRLHHFEEKLLSIWSVYGYVGFSVWICDDHEQSSECVVHIVCGGNQDARGM